MLTQLNLQNFHSLIDKCRNYFQRRIYACDNGIVQHFVYLHLMWLRIIAIWCEWFYVFYFYLFLFFIFLLKIFTVCSMGWLPEIKIDWFIG